jgi:Flp pilus assembly pilin Flp
LEEVGPVIEALILFQAAVDRLRVVRGQRGQGMSEYALILVLVAVAVLVALGALGKQISAVFDRIKTALNAA